MMKGANVGGKIEFCVLIPRPIRFLLSCDGLVTEIRYMNAIIYNSVFKNILNCRYSGAL